VGWWGVWSLMWGGGFFGDKKTNYFYVLIEKGSEGKEGLVFAAGCGGKGL